MQAKVAPFLAQYRTCTWAVLAFAIGGLGSVARADTTNLPFPESVLADSDGLLAVTIGPGGADVEFGLSEANGRIYRIALDGSTTVAVEIDALKLVNPTGIVALGDKVFLTDGAMVLALDRSGELMWRNTHKAENTLLYDIDVGPNGQLLVTDFGNGRLLQAEPETSAFRRLSDR